MIDSMTKDDVLSALGEISKHFEDCTKETYGSIHEIFHYWMNAADWAATYLNDPAPTVGGWISVRDRLPEEHPSIFASCYGTEKWAKGMWRNESDRVLVTVLFPDGTRTVDKGKLQDGTWKTGVSPVLPQVVTHWAMWPEPPKEENDDS